MSLEKFPDKWKMANVTPIYKSKELNQVSNYRPISLLSLAKKTYYEACFNKYKSDIKNTWKTINTLLCTRKNSKCFPEFFNINGARITDKQQIADEFNKYFTNIGPSLANEITSPNDKSYTDYLTTPTNVKTGFQINYN